MDNIKTIERSDFLQVIVPSVGCRYRKCGYCIECNYGSAQNIDIDTAKKMSNDIVNKVGTGISQVVFSSYGSMFDDLEVSDDVLIELLKPLNKLYIGLIIIETHCDTVNKHKLDLVKRCLPDRVVGIEMGLESSNPIILRQCINKKLDLDRMKSAIKMIKQSGFGVDLNILYGTPFLNSTERETDVLNSIYWAFENGADEFVLFPMNIKPNTPLMNLYKAGKYNRVRHSEFIRLLSKIPDRFLGRICLSSYGDRQHSGMDKDWIPPLVDVLNEDELMQWYSSFTSTFDIGERRELLDNICKIIEYNNAV